MVKLKMISLWLKSLYNFWKMVSPFQFRKPFSPKSFEPPPSPPPPSPTRLPTLLSFTLKHTHWHRFSLSQSILIFSFTPAHFFSSLFLLLISLSVNNCSDSSFSFSRKSPESLIFPLVRLFLCFSSPDLFLLLVFHKVCRFPPCFMGFIWLI